MTHDLLTTLRGWQVPIRDGVLHYLNYHLDAENHERCQRINGYAECPDCGLAWPMIDEPEAWTLSEATGVWEATDFGPATAECLDCGLCIVDTFDGCFVIRPERKP